MKDYMLIEIEQQPSVLKNIYVTMKEKIFEKIKSLQDKYKIKKIVLTGSGDSHCAALTTTYSFLLQGYQTFPVAPMEFSRYKYRYSQFLDENTLLIAISVSGRTKRVIEAIHAAKSRNAKVFAVTNDPESPVAALSDDFIYAQSSSHESIKQASYQGEISSKYVGYEHDVPQTKSYTAVQMTLLLIALSLDRDPYYQIVSQIPECVGEIINNPLIKELGVRNAQASNYIYCASGPNYGNAVFGEYKMYEFAMQGIASDIEEYCHTSYFATTNNSPVMFLAPSGESLQRTSEIAPVLKNIIKTNAIIVSNKEPNFDYSDWIEIPFVGAEEFSIIPYGIVTPIFAFWCAKTLGRNVNTFRGGVEQEKYVTGSYHTIRESKIKRDY